MRTVVVGFHAASGVIGIHMQSIEMGTDVLDWPKILT